MDHGDAREVERGERLGVGRPILHHHHGGLDEIEDVSELGVVLAHQRIGRRHRRRRQPRLHRGLRDKRVLDGIGAEDRDRPAVAHLDVEQRLGQRVDGALGLGIGHLAPLPLGSLALRQPGVIRPRRRPFRERRRDVRLERIERGARLQNDHAVRPPLHRDVARQPRHLAERRLHRRRCGVSRLARSAVTFIAVSSSPPPSLRGA